MAGICGTRLAGCSFGHITGKFLNAAGDRGGNLLKINTKRSTCFILLTALLLICLGFCSTGYAEEKPLFDFDASGTMVIIPLDDTAVAAAKDFVKQIQESSIVHVSGMVYSPPGVAAKLVLSGSQSDLQQALELYQKLVKGTSKQLVVISASLRELTSEDTRDVGIKVVPKVDGTSTFNWGRENDGSRIKNNSQAITGTWSDMAALNDALAKSKVLVSSEVYTPNGVKAQIANVKSVPTFSTDSNGNVETQYQNLETSIGVVPTIIAYNPEKPEESLVRVGVDIKVSIISDTQTYRDFSAPEYSVKTMTTTRILTANNQSNVIGTFITDSDINTVSGVPILGKLPLLKYLFSQEHKEKVRNTAVLTLSVRLLPVPSAGDK